MAQYYFVGTLLPSLSMESSLEISLSDLELLLRENLTEKDYEKAESLRLYYDILNLRSLWKQESFDPRGELSSYQMEEALLSRTKLPDYVFDFLERYTKKEDLLRHFPWLLAQFFKEAATLKDAFLSRYFSFERKTRLVLTAFRAKKLGRDLAAEFQYEDPEEELIAQLLAQKDAPFFEFPEGYSDLKLMIEKHAQSPMKLQQAIDSYRFEKIEEWVEMKDQFSIERILAYLVQYMIVEKWADLDGSRGGDIIRAVADSPSPRSLENRASI